MDMLETMLQQTKTNILNSLGRRDSSATTSAASGFAAMMAKRLQEQVAADAASTASDAASSATPKTRSDSAAGRYEPTSLEPDSIYDSVFYTEPVKTQIDRLFSEGGDFDGWTIKDLATGLQEEMIMFGTEITSLSREYNVLTSFSPSIQSCGMRIPGLAENGKPAPLDFGSAVANQQAFEAKQKDLQQYGKEAKELGQDRERMKAANERFYNIAFRSAIVKLAEQDPEFAQQFEENPQQAIEDNFRAITASVSRSRISHDDMTGEVLLKF